jgi:hypothetical protein
LLTNRPSKTLDGYWSSKSSDEPGGGVMIDFKAELTQRVQVLYKIALDFLDEDDRFPWVAMF